MNLPEIVLDVDSSDYIDDDLYDRLLDAFVARARDMGYDVVNTPDLVISDWRISARLERVA